MILQSSVVVLGVVFLAHIVEPPYRARTFLRISSDSQRWCSRLTRGRTGLFIIDTLPSCLLLKEGIVEERSV